MKADSLRKGCSSTKFRHQNESQKLLCGAQIVIQIREEPNRKFSFAPQEIYSFQFLAAPTCNCILNREALMGLSGSSVSKDTSETYCSPQMPLD